MPALYKNRKRLWFGLIIPAIAIIGALIGSHIIPIDSNSQAFGAPITVTIPPSATVFAPTISKPPGQIKLPNSPTPYPTIPVKKQSFVGIHVQGNALLNAQNQKIRLFGANRSGTEYACLSGGFSDGPTDQASIQAMQRWHINAVRVPLNESCWLGINGASFAGSAYQQAVKQYVNLITANNMIAIVDLHWNAPGNLKAEGQTPMPDADHTPAFWKSVATTLKDNPNVVFDLFNEPDPIPYRGDYPGGFSVWQHDDFNCLLNGCQTTTKSGVTYQGVGMQQLVNTVRATGAKNVIMIAGIQSAQTITQYQGNKNTSPSGFMPTDPLNNLTVAMHQYNNAACSDQQCWDATVAPVAKIYPIITGEFGDTDCTDVYTKQLLPWLDTHGISYVGWTWDKWQSSCEALIQDYAGTPTSPYGQAYFDHLQQISN